MVITVHFVETTSSAPMVTHVIPGGAGVNGVTSLGDDVFVLRYQSQQVEVYDAVTFTLQRRISVPGLGESHGLAACASNRCLYASDFYNNRVHSVELSGSNAVTKWSVGRKPAGLIVNSAKNVVVVIQSKRKLKEFTTHGTLLQTIQLQPDIEIPDVLLRWQNLASHKQRHTIVQGLCFSVAKDLGEIPTGSPPTGAPNRGGWVRSGDLLPISRCITGSAVALHCCKAHSKSIGKMKNSTPCKIVTPENFILKLGIRDYVNNITHYTNFHVHRFSGGFSANR